MHRAHHAHETRAILRAADARNDLAATASTWLVVSGTDTITARLTLLRGWAIYPLETLTEGGPINGVRSPRYGTSQLVAPRLGQGSFRAAVLDAYGGRCAITGDRVVHVLQAAHIRSFSRGGPHLVRNGLLLRSDLHTLFDRGYLTVTSDYRLAVSLALRDEFNNGREYLAMSGNDLGIPVHPDDHPDRGFLAWHANEVFRGRAA